MFVSEGDCPESYPKGAPAAVVRDQPPGLGASDRDLNQTRNDRTFSSGGLMEPTQGKRKVPGLAFDRWK